MDRSEGVVSGFCLNCRCGVDIYEHKVTLDNGEVIVYWEGTCPICGRILEDDII